MSNLTAIKVQKVAISYTENGNESVNIQQSYGNIVQRKVGEEMSRVNSRIQQNNKKGMSKWQE